jgi:hypothetical protein
MRGPYFKMRHDQYQTLPEEIELTCQYRGHREAHSSFMSSAQHARVMAAAERLRRAVVARAGQRHLQPDIRTPHGEAEAVELVREHRVAPDGTAAGWS